MDKKAKVLMMNYKNLNGKIPPIVNQVKTMAKIGTCTGCTACAYCASGSCFWAIPFGLAATCILSPLIDKKVETEVNDLAQVSKPKTYKKGHRKEK